MTSSIEPNGKPKIVYAGKIGALVDYPMRITHDGTTRDVTFQKFVRPPGTRIIAINEKSLIYLQQEARAETDNPDWRLPGGKVLDTFEEYIPYLEEEIPTELILDAAQRELQEEAQITSNDLQIIHRSTSGSSVTWDLFYITAENISKYENTHHELEPIISGSWFAISDVRDMCMNKQIQEDRSVAVLLRYIDKYTNK